MPQSNNTPLNQSMVPQGSNIPKVDYQVAASPVSFSADNSELQQAQQLAQDLAAFTGRFEQFSNQQSQQVIKHETEQAVMDTIHDPAAKPVFTGEESAWYQQSRTKLYAEGLKNKGIGDFRAEMARIKEDPTRLNGMSPQSYLDKWYQENIAGIDDPDVAAVVYPAFQAEMLGARDDLTKVQQVQAKKELFGQAQDTIGSLFADSDGNPRLPTPAEMWQTAGTLVSSGMPKDMVLSVLAERIHYAYNAENQGDAPLLFQSMGPNGITFANSREENYSFKKTVTAVTQQHTAEQVRKQLKAEQDARVEEQDKYQAEVVTRMSNAGNGHYQSEEAIAHLKESDKARIRAAYNEAITKEATKHADQEVALALGDNPVDPIAAIPGNEKNAKLAQDTRATQWKTKYDSARAQADEAVQQGQPQAVVYGAEGNFHKVLQEINKSRIADNTSVPLDFLSVEVSGVSTLPAMAQSGPNAGRLPEKAIRARAMFDALYHQPGGQATLRAIFKNDQDYAFMSAWYGSTAMTSAEPVAAYEQMKNNWDTQAKGALTSFYTNPDNIKNDLVKELSTKLLDEKDGWGIFKPLTAGLDSKALTDTLHLMLTRDMVANALVNGGGTIKGATTLLHAAINKNYSLYEGDGWIPGWSDEAILVPSLEFKPAESKDSLRQVGEKWAKNKYGKSLHELGFQDSMWPAATGLFSKLSLQNFKDRGWAPKDAKAMTLVPTNSGTSFQVLIDGVPQPGRMVPVGAVFESWVHHVGEANQQRAENPGFVGKVLAKVFTAGTSLHALPGVNLEATRTSAMQNYIRKVHEATERAENQSSKVAENSMVPKPLASPPTFLTPQAKPKKQQPPALEVPKSSGNPDRISKSDIPRPSVQYTVPPLTADIRAKLPPGITLQAPPEQK